MNKLSVIGSCQQVVIIKIPLKQGSKNKIFEFHLAHWASNPQILLARGTSPLAQVINLSNNS